MEVPGEKGLKVPEIATPSFCSQNVMPEILTRLFFSWRNLKGGAAPAACPCGARRFPKFSIPTVPCGYRTCYRVFSLFCYSRLWRRYVTVQFIPTLCTAHYLLQSIHVCLYGTCVLYSLVHFLLAEPFFFSFISLSPYQDRKSVV